MKPLNHWHLKKVFSSIGNITWSCIRMERAARMEKDQTICLNLSGRGDKDAMEAARIMGVSGLPKMSFG